MANVYAVSAGNWSVPARWNTGSLPTAADDVFANGFAVTIDQDITVISIQTRSAVGIAAGGSFTASTTRTINASIYSGSTTCLSLSGISNTFNVNATTIQGPNAANTVHGINCGGTTNNINITATNCTGASATFGNGHGINCGGTSNIYVINSTNITGGSGSGNSNYGINFAMTAGTPSVTLISTTITGGTVAGNNNGILIQNTVSLTYTISGNVVAANAVSAVSIAPNVTTTINWTGNVTGGTGGNSIFGITTAGTLWTLNLTGDVTGGSGGSNNYGIFHNSTNGIVNVIGTSFGGVAAQGCFNNTTGTLRVRTAQASSTFVGLVGGVNTGTTTFEQSISASNGLNGFSSFCKLKLGSNNFVRYPVDTGGTKDLIDSANVANGQPAASNVRLGTVYNFGGTTGTLAVPLPSQVLSGVATDATVGTFTGANPPTASDNADAVWNRALTAITTSGSVGERVKNCATVQTTGDQIVALT